MRWQVGRRSDNVEDQRGSGRRPARRAAGVGIGTILVAAAAAYFFGIDPRAVIQVAEQVQQQAPAEPAADPGTPRVPRPDDLLADFSARVLADTEDTWSSMFEAAGRKYAPPVLVLFDDSVGSACGTNSSAVGPFYCPPDQRLYLDLSFFDELTQRFGAPGDFAQAYVIAHEVGHHVQQQLGISASIDEHRRGMSREQANELSVRQELQADCYAGAWAKNSAIQLDPGDIEEGMRAAGAIGDDRIQRESQGRVSPETWTHGSSEMRMRWLRRGMETGDPNSCDTFAAAEL